MKKPLLFIISLFCLIGSIDASKSKPFKSKEAADAYLTKHYNLGCTHYNVEEWRSAYEHFEKVIYFFPDSDEAAEASYYLGVCYYMMCEYDFANKEFSDYITASCHPAFFEDAVRYKFCIAEEFRSGKKRRPFTSRYLPKWISAQDEALAIYDEVIVALPNHELTVCALRSKAELLRQIELFRESVDTYQALIRRFPKDEYTPECYVKIAEIFCEQSVQEFQNPDILAFAELNARKFTEDFPREERIACVNELVQKIKENSAKGLCGLGLFYERKHHPQAAEIYYKTSIAAFPDTKCAKFCKARLLLLPFEKEEKDVIVPLGIMREEMDPLEYDEKATVSEGGFIDGLPQLEAPGIEATSPYEGYDNFIEGVVNEPASVEYPHYEYVYPHHEMGPPEEFRAAYDPTNKVYYDEGHPPYEGNVCSSEQRTFSAYSPTENDVYEEPYYVTGSEEDNVTTFHNGHAYYPPEPEEPRRVYKVVRKKEPEPKAYAHYSLLKRRQQKKNGCQSQ